MLMPGLQHIIMEMEIDIIKFMIKIPMIISSLRGFAQGLNMLFYQQIMEYLWKLKGAMKIKSFSLSFLVISTHLVIREMQLTLEQQEQIEMSISTMLPIGPTQYNPSFGQNLLQIFIVPDSVMIVIILQLGIKMGRSFIFIDFVMDVLLALIEIKMNAPSVIKRWLDVLFAKMVPNVSVVMGVII